MIARARLAGCLVLLLAGSAPASAQHAALEGFAVRPDVSWGAELDTNSRYVWLGQAFSTRAVAQPSVWVTRGPFTGNAWGSVHVAPESQTELGVAELDLILSWSGKVGPISTTFTSDTYWWRTRSSKFVNTEVLLRTARPVGPVEVFAVQLLDLHRYRGSYHVTAGASGAKSRGEWKAGLQATAGWSSARFNRYYLGVEKRGLLEASVEASLTRALGRRTYVRAHVAVTTLIDRDLRHALGAPSHVVPGIAVGFQ